MRPKPDLFKRRTGRTLEERRAARTTADHAIARRLKRLKSGYDLRLLGVSKEIGIVEMTEEERYLNFHILGAPGEGKSKLLEYHIREDIDRGNGLLLLDPSDKGDTARNILNYCAQIGYEKVILIDPTLTAEYKKIPCLAPLSANYVDKSVDGVMEALEILFKADYSTMRRIRRNLSALLRILARNGLTLSEAQYFSDYNLDADKRKTILGFDRDSILVKSFFKSPYTHDLKFSSTVNIMDVLWREPVKSIVSNTEGINFRRVVGDGWVVLVNLSPYYMTDEQAELLGIMIISQIIQAVDSLANNNWKGKFHLYIDEVGSFASPQIKTLLQKKRKSGVVMYLAHHDYQQFKGKEEIAAAIENSARIKLMFNTPGYDDRMKMIKALGYGGNIPHALAVYANSDLPKQHAVLKKGKEPPVRIRIPNVETAPDAPKEYIEKILSQPFYKDVPTNETARPQGDDTVSTQRRAKNDRKPDSTTGISDKGVDLDKWKTLSQNLPSGKQHAPKDGKKERD
ncbi:MAG TPA: type IV secretory system conjugative DNA transfer family protein [Pyrinomonadaceae bacterium]|jgi:hypothetical protein